MPNLFVPPSKPEEITDAAQLVSMITARRGAFYLRGQSDIGWGITPTIGREHWFAGHRVHGFDADTERDLLHQFRRHSYPHRQRVLDEWESLFPARHHGLPVRLVDWTTNPLVALFWACRYEKQTEIDGAIWWFQRRESNKAAHLDVFTGPHPLEVKGIRLIFPFYPTQRMTVQAGVLTVHGEPHMDITTLASDYYPPADNDIEAGGMYVVPKVAKANLLCQLERLSINSRTLLPELDVMAAGLWHSQVLRRMERELAK